MRKSLAELVVEKLGRKGIKYRNTEVSSLEGIIPGYGLLVEIEEQKLGEIHIGYSIKLKLLKKDEVDKYESQEGEVIITSKDVNSIEGIPIEVESFTKRLYPEEFYLEVREEGGKRKIVLRAEQAYA
ncbi:MAG: hypothetical protein J7K98_01975 [Candidatus Aenigmarchaeota archaeon]|nr:hypothetical protein [Candidatus Aenigmarchaeota archaeon]